MKDLQLKCSNVLLNLVMSEHRRQIEKWGVQDRDPFEWLAYATEELGEVSNAISEWTYRGGEPRDVVKEAVQLATLSLKIVEMFLDVTLHTEDNNCRDSNGDPIKCQDCAAYAGGGCEGKRK